MLLLLLLLLLFFVFNFCNIDRGTYPTFVVITENLFSVFEKISFLQSSKGLTTAIACNLQQSNG